MQPPDNLKIPDGLTLTANGYELPNDPSVLGHLEAATDALGDSGALNDLMAQRGYLFFPGLLDRDAVLNARQEILQKYAIVGEIQDIDANGQRVLMDAIAASPEDGALTTANLRAFSASVRSGFWYRSVTEADPLMSMYEDLLGGHVHCYDFRWPRFVRPGEGCGFHCDGPYMNRGTDRVYSSWIPLGFVPPENGSLIILEDSHSNDALHAGYLQKDADEDQLVWLDDDPMVVAERYGRRWLTASFEPGDVLCFSMHTLHGALDNQAPGDRCRLTSDSRYQLASEPRDQRWNGADAAAGEDVEGHGGSRVFYPGLGSWQNADFQDEWKYVDSGGRLVMPDRSFQHGEA